ncbi:hypothetical protein SXANM310S_03884 [Streptomyces xanthochromogenes]
MPLTEAPKRINIHGHGCLANSCVPRVRLRHGAARGPDARRVRRRGRQGRRGVPAPGHAGRRQEGRGVSRRAGQGRRLRLSDARAGRGRLHRLQERDRGAGGRLPHRQRQYRDRARPPVGRKRLPVEGQGRRTRQDRLPGPRRQQHDRRRGRRDRGRGGHPARRGRLETAPHGRVQGRHRHAPGGRPHDAEAGRGGRPVRPREVRLHGRARRRHGPRCAGPLHGGRPGRRLHLRGP